MSTDQIIEDANTAIRIHEGVLRLKAENAALRDAVEYAHSQGFEWPSDPLAGVSKADKEADRTLLEILDDLEKVAVNFDNGWRAEPPTMAALVRRIIRELKAANE